MTLIEMQSFITEICKSWSEVRNGWYTKPNEIQMRDVDGFAAEYYIKLDTLKNISDDNGFVFDRLDKVFQNKFQKCCSDYDFSKRQIAPERRRQENIKLQKDIDEVSTARQSKGLSSQSGLFADGKKPSPEDVRREFFASYGANVISI